MKKITLTLAAVAAAISMNAQTVLFEDDFESHDDFIIDNIGSWTMVDVDGSPTYGFNGITFNNSGYTGSFIVFNTTTTNPPLDPSDAADWSARSGNKSLACFAASTPSNDDWLITPLVTLEDQENTLKFYAKAADGTYSNEVFDVAISTTDTQPASFTVIDGNLTPSPAMQWVEYEYDLDAYAGQDVYVAIHVKSNDQFGFQIDDFSITAGGMSIDENSFEGFTYYQDLEYLTLKAQSPMANVEVYNLLGQKIATHTLNTVEVQLPIASLQAGVYVAKVTIEGKVRGFKFVIN